MKGALASREEALAPLPAPGDSPRLRLLSFGILSACSTSEKTLSHRLYPAGFPLLWLTFLSFVYFQHQISEKAVAALSSLYGTNYKYGSIITTICK